MKVCGLRVENRISPIDLSAPKPVFGWRVTAAEENWRQKEYRIRMTKEGRETVWDTGFVEGNRMTEIPYEGLLLEPDTRYFWKVDCVSKEGEIASSEETWFETGLFGPKDWKGIYIGETKDHEYHLYRKTFEVEQKVRKAKLYVCGLGHHEFYINGKRVSDRVLEPGWSDYRKTCFYSAYDVTDLLVPGKNAAGVKLGDGMFNVPGAASEGRYVYYERSYGKCKLNVQLHITYEDGTSAFVVTDESWKQTKSPILYCCIYGGELYDGRLWPEGFSTAEYDDKDWEPVTQVEPPMGRVTASPAEPVKVMQTFEPVSVTETAPGVYLYDLGTNFSGWARIRIQTDGNSAGKKIVMTPGELLDESMRPNQKATGHDYRWEYILNEKEAQEFAPDFTYTGFRYVQVEGAVPETEAEKGAGIPVLQSLTGEFLYTAVETTGSFTCSNQLFNDIHRIVTQAILSNMKSYFTDCPHREKLPWLEQSHLIGPSIFYNYGVQNIYAKMEQDMADSQRENGLVPDICPEYVVFGYHEGFVDSPEWGSACILNPWYLYKRYGTTSLLERYYDKMERYIRYLESRTHHHILHHGLGDWLDIGPCTPYSQNTAVPIVATSIYYYDLGVMEEISRLLGKEEEAAHYQEVRKEVFREYNLQFLDNQTGRYGTGSQASQALSLMAGLVPKEYEEKAVKQLRDEVVKRNYAITAGDIGHPFLIAAMMKYGMSDLLNEMTNITETPGYGYQVVNGATTLTEEWDGPNPERPHGSQNHLMLGSIEEWFYGGLAGLASIRSGLPFDEVLIKPHIAKGVNFCQASMTHPYGKVEVSWKRRGTQAEVTVTVPPNLTAHLESEDGSVKRKVGSGVHTYLVPAK
ncbi:MAG: family 78 glycoside hydrolase catalytic domain [Eubacteriales bacterium]|nr:family 78 glycoside hydrolase catalytic domain [Eubacteriales bacterium]